VYSEMNKRILYISPSTVPSTSANSVQVMKMCNQFVHQGFDTKLLCYANMDGKPSDCNSISKGYGVSERLRIGFYPQSKFLRKFKRTLYIVAQYFSFKPGIIYCRSLGLISSLRFFNTNFIVEFHSPFRNEKEIKLLRDFWISGKLSKIVAISGALKDILLKQCSNFLKSENVVVAHDAIDFKMFDSLKMKESISQKPVIGYIGSLYAGRGIELILSIAQMLPNYDFHIIGGDKEGVEKYSKIASDSNILNITFFGHQPNSMLPKFYDALDVLLMPYQSRVSVAGNQGNSVDWMSPLKLFEYMATFRPLISSDLPVLREVLNPGVNCIMVDEFGDANEWVKGILQLLQDHDLYSTIAKQAREDVMHHTLENRLKQILSGLD